MSEVRTNVIRLGQPMLAAALHVFVAQMEAKRGVLSIAKRHTSIALSSLATSRNLWLEATVENINAGLAIFQSDFDAAFVHAKRSVSLAEESGAVSARQSALANLGNVSYLLGRFDEAIDYYGRGTGRVDSGRWTTGTHVLRVSARAYMIQGDANRVARSCSTNLMTLSVTTDHVGPPPRDRLRRQPRTLLPLRTRARRRSRFGYRARREHSLRALTRKAAPPMVWRCR